jgi:hypothetical protein
MYPVTVTLLRQANEQFVNLNFQHIRRLQITHVEIIQKFISR